MASTDNLSVVIHGLNDVRLENRPIPEIEEHEALLRTSKVGICGTDVSFITKGKLNDYTVDGPLVIGHELSAVVEKCGAAVKHLKPGDRVAIQPAITCQKCDYCLGGRVNLCPNLTRASVPPTQGFMSRYFKHSAEYCYKLPDTVSQEEGAFMEPLAVVVHACDRANMRFGSKVLICGSGAIGLMILLTVKAMGASKVCVTDILDEKLEFAKKLGADATLNVRSGKPEELANEVKKVMGGTMPDITFECTGVEPSIRLAVFATVPGGKVIVVGLGPPDVSVPILRAAFKEVDILTVVGYPNTFQRAIDMVGSGKVNVKALITHNFKLEEALKAIETFISGNPGAIKIMISC